MESKNFVIIGKVEDLFGYGGTLKVKPFAPQRVWEGIEKIYLKRKGGDFVPFEVEKIEVRGKKVFLKLKGVEDEENALRMVGAHIFYPEDGLPKLKSGEYYYYQLVGAKVVGKSGKGLGTVQYIHTGGPYPMLVLEEERLIPFTKNFVEKVDLERKTIVVNDERLPEG
jgi:16S rRNA processing protein RimM